MSPTIAIYTDGSAFPNPGGPGGWAFVVLYDGQEHLKRSGGLRRPCTNNIAELMAAIEALKWLPEGAQATIFTDSQYVQKGANWWRKSWAKKDFEGRKNAELWRELHGLMLERDCVFKWVRGHNGDKWNELCDRLADSERTRQ